MNAEEKFPTFNVHKADKLKQLIVENPDLPLVVLANEEANTGDYSTMFCSCIHAEIGEILDCNQTINDEICFTDRDDFREEIEEMLYNGTDEDEELNIDWVENKINEIEAEYEPYWKKCIILTVGN